MTASIELHYADEWAALYVDGRLDLVGDARTAALRAFVLLDVRVVRDAAFRQGGTGVAGVAQTLAQVDAYRAAVEANAVEAQRLRVEAAAMLAKAKELDA